MRVSALASRRHGSGSTSMPVSRRRYCRTYVRYAPTMTKVPTPELVENRRRSIAMLPSGVPALNRDEALELLRQLEAALLELRRIGKAQSE